MTAPTRFPSTEDTALSAPDLASVHRRLAHWNHMRLSPAVPTAEWRRELNHEHEMRRLEGAWVETLREAVVGSAAAVPQDADDFVAWFEDLKISGPGQGDLLFPWLAETADMDQMRWFLEQEAAGEAGFDDLVALAQLKLPSQPKLELARNYWDEMGRGHMGGMHSLLLDQTAQALNLNPSIDETVWPSLALANTLTAFATTRRYAYHAVGALGVVELTAPGRVAQVAAGLKRLGAPPAARKYFELHAHLDVQHSHAWNEEALKPLIRENPACARYLSEGALMRLICGRLCFEAYRGHLWA